MVVKLLHFWKQYDPNDVTDEGILMEVKSLQFWYLQPVITQYFASNKSEIWS